MHWDPGYSLSVMFSILVPILLGVPAFIAAGDRHLVS